MTGYQDPHLPETVDQLVVDNSMFRVFQDHFVTNTMRAEGTLWSLLASISQGWEAIQTTQKNALSHPRFQEFLHNPNCTWDLVIASPFINEAGVMLADHFRAPMILYLPANAGEFLSLSLGHPDSVAWSGAMAGSLGGRINTLLGHMAYELLIKPKYFVQPQAGFGIRDSARYLNLLIFSLLPKVKCSPMFQQQQASFMKSETQIPPSYSMQSYESTSPTTRWPRPIPILNETQTLPSTSPPPTSAA